VHTGLTRHHAKFTVTTSAELYLVYRTCDSHAAALTRHFSSIEPLFIRGRGLRAAKLDGECDKVHTGLTRHHINFTVITSAELYHVYCTWDPYAAAVTPQFSSIEPLFIRCWFLPSSMLRPLEVTLRRSNYAIYSTVIITFLKSNKVEYGNCDSASRGPRFRKHFKHPRDQRNHRLLTLLLPPHLH
jgi:hypothetical protein